MGKTKNGEISDEVKDGNDVTKDAMGVVGSKFGSHTGSKSPEEQFAVWGLGLYITTEQSKQDQYSTPLMLESGEQGWTEFYHLHRTRAQTDKAYTLDDFDEYLQQYYQHTKFALVTEADVSGFVTLPAQVSDLFGGNVRVNEWMEAYQEWYDKPQVEKATVDKTQRVCGTGNHSR